MNIPVRYEGAERTIREDVGGAKIRYDRDRVVARHFPPFLSTYAIERKVAFSYSRGGYSA
jgi:hypothetical protein